MKITQEQFDELDSLQSIDTKALNKKLEELLGVNLIPFTGYQYYDGYTYIGNSCDDTVNDLLNKMGVQIEK